MPTLCCSVRMSRKGTPFKVVKGLVEEFGKERIIDTPISEAGFTGLAVGAAMTGLRPVVDIMFGDFMTSSWTRSSTRPPRSITCRAAGGRCRSSSARRWARRGGRRRSTHSRCMHGRATFQG